MWQVGGCPPEFKARGDILVHSLSWRFHKRGRSRRTCHRGSMTAKAQVSGDSSVQKVGNWVWHLGPDVETYQFKEGTF